MRKVKNNKGVTLVALVITIIVLLILASVSISLLFGQDGIITRAQDAARNWEEASKHEEDTLDILLSKIDKAEMGVADWSDNVSVIMTDEKIPVPLPEGFVNTDITNSINEGIVIEDEDDGNQFVWVSIRNTLFARKKWENTWGFTLTSEEIKNGVWDEIEELEYKKMVEKVGKYGGFYIGRYESSYKGGSSIADYEAYVKPSGSAKSAQGSYEIGQLWNWISCNDAKSISNKLYEDSEIVTSFLPWGINFDTTLQWLIYTGEKIELDMGEDSKNWGNFRNSALKGALGSSVIANTGEISAAQANNIYDLAGNIQELTQEKVNIDNLRVNGVVRGGGYTHETHINNASIRNNNSMTAENNATGFRIYMYIKD